MTPGTSGPSSASSTPSRISSGKRRAEGTEGGEGEKKGGGTKMKEKNEETSIASLRSPPSCSFLRGIASMLDNKGGATMLFFGLVKVAAFRQVTCQTHTRLQ